MSNLSNEYTADFIQQLLDKIDTLTFLVTEQTATINELKGKLAILIDKPI